MTLDPRILLQPTTPDLMSAISRGVQAGQAIRRAPLEEALLRSQAKRAESLASQPTQSQMPRFIGTPQRVSVGEQNFLTGIVSDPSSPSGFREERIEVAGEFVSPLGQTAAEQVESQIAKTGGAEQARLEQQRRLQPLITEGVETSKAEVELKTKPGIAKQVSLAEDAAKISTESFQKIPGIEQNIQNLDEGIRLIDEGAETGTISRMLPSIRESSKRMDNLKNRLGLDVIASVTFGALSEQELKTAFDTALPTGLEGPALRKWLVERRDAQTKMINSLEEAAVFLSEEGNTLPMLLKVRRDAQKQQREAEKAPVETKKDFDLEYDPETGSFK